MEIKCHPGIRAVWRGPLLDREPCGEAFRSCSYCGSIHPEDLIKLLSEGATMHGADWKYGWPHKFYVQNIPNPHAGKIVEIGSKSGPDINASTPGAKFKFGYWSLPEMAPAPAKMRAKFYNVHLADCSTELFDRLASLLLQHTGIGWRRGEKGITYQAPEPGYQKP